MNTVIDFHSHILPGMDDGSASAEESIAMLKLEAEQGIRKVIATPHFYPRYDTPDQFLSRRKAAEERLRAAMADREGLPEVSVGAEVYYYPGISSSDILSELTIGGKTCILIEMPPPPWTDGMYRELEGIAQRQGLLPIIAHIDRYVRPFKTHRIPERLTELPVLVQANAGFFLDRATRGLAMRMLCRGQIHLLGSDCHNLHDRAPNLEPALRRIRQQLGEDAVLRIRENEAYALRERTAQL